MNYYLTVLLKLVFAALLGALIGFEREYKNRPAGLRTNMLVCLGAALIQILALDIFAVYGGITNIDPARLGAQVISGIGFLGAGTIIHEGASIKGLTTAAGLWVVACIGLAIGNGSYVPGILAALLAYTTLRALKGLERYVASKSLYLNVEIRMEDRPGLIGNIGQILGSMNASIKNIEFRKHGEEIYSICLTIKLSRIADKQEVMASICKVEGVYSVEEV
ncbi:MAG: MgtC/SapB family protein [Gracilibacteraceae bacterium]|nr:MgtC/SapB family protein [Gracilibacteraceae bacterium]